MADDYVCFMAVSDDYVCFIDISDDYVCFIAVFSSPEKVASGVWHPRQEPRFGALTAWRGPGAPGRPRDG